MDNPPAEKPNDEIVRRANPAVYAEGMTGVNALAEMIRRLKDTIIEQQETTNRLTSCLYWFTIAIFFFGAVRVAILVYQALFTS